MVPPTFGRINCSKATGFVKAHDVTRERPNQVASAWHVQFQLMIGVVNHPSQKSLQMGGVNSTIKNEVVHSCFTRIRDKQQIPQMSIGPTLQPNSGWRVPGFRSSFECRTSERNTRPRDWNPASTAVGNVQVVLRFDSQISHCHVCRRLLHVVYSNWTTSCAHKWI